MLVYLINLTDITSNKAKVKAPVPRGRRDLFELEVDSYKYPILPEINIHKNIGLGVLRKVLRAYITTVYRKHQVDIHN